MKRMLFRCFALVGLCAALATAQPSQPAESPKVNQPLPFKAGETLRYEVTFSKLIFGGTVGDVKLSVAGGESSSKSPRLTIKAVLASKGFLPKLFGIKVRDTYSATVSAQDLGLQESVRSLSEGNNRREQKAIIDRDTGRVTFIDRNLMDKKAEPKTKEAPSPAWIQDILSALYFVRAQPLNEGDVIEIPISDAGEIYHIEVIAEKPEEMKVDAGKFKTIRLNAKIFDGRFIRRSGEMWLWVSDDARRIPVRARLKFSGATVTVDLKRIQS
ncbi:MAG: DUF3108 domain-containing protein [Blastocatellia bacterium]